MRNLLTLKKTILLVATIVLAAGTSFAGGNSCEKSFQSAQLAGLHVRDSSLPGITRVQVGEKEFNYYDPDGQMIVNVSELSRIIKIGIPPAWERVSISTDPLSHIQATGFDSAGRLQYRYHPRWIEIRSIEKFRHIKDFGEALPRLRRAVDTDLKSKDSKRRLLAAVVKLLEKSLIRVGGKEYAEENETFGLTTFTAGDVTVSGNTIRFQFVGKEHISHDISVTDKQLAEIVSQQLEKDIPTLFEVTSDQVNKYIKEKIGPQFTAKNFRTWMGTIWATTALLNEGATTKDAFHLASQKLGNTPAIAKKSYVHPKIIEAFESGALQQAVEHSGGNVESAVLLVLNQ